MATNSDDALRWPDRRQLLLGGTMAGASLLAFAIRPRAGTAIAQTPIGPAIPPHIGGYIEHPAAGMVMPDETPLTERVYLETMTRIYAEPSAPPIMLLIGTGRADDPGMTVHRPERCYRSIGFRITGTEQVPLSAPFPSGSAATFLTAQRDDRREHILFWVRIGRHFPTSEFNQKLVVIEDNLAGTLPAGILARLSVVGEDAAVAKDQLLQFNDTMIRAVSAATRARMIGA